MEADPHFYWYVTRAAGVVAFWLLTMSAALGLGITSRLWDELLNRPWVFEMHRFASILALGFVGLHTAALLPDPWTDFHVIDLVAPGTSPYRAGAVAAGVIAMYGAIVSTATFYLKRRMGHRTWRTLHYASFLTFLLALLHGIYAGTDSGESWMRVSYLSAGLLVFFLTTYRILAAPLPRPPRLAGRSDTAPVGGS